MEVNFTNEGAVIFTDDCFDLKNTFDCGQCFRWDMDADGSYRGTVRGRRAHILSRNGCAVIEGCGEEEFNTVWKDYLDLDSDYNSIRMEITELCPQLACAVESIDGIRILRQEPWEALCSFIISQNNNIPRIKGIVSRLCEGFGDNIDGVFSFPPPDRIARLNEEDLAPLRSGFRARYIIDAARKVFSGEVDLDGMREAPLNECRKELMSIVGVGAKVAECTLLYGLHRLEAFPIDVWMKKALSTTFSGITVDSLGRYAGIAQQYIFHYSRLLAAQGSDKA